MILPDRNLVATSPIINIERIRFISGILIQRISACILLLNSWALGSEEMEFIDDISIVDRQHIHAPVHILAEYLKLPSSPASIQFSNSLDAMEAINSFLCEVEVPLAAL